MNLIRYPRIFICVVLATTFSAIDNPSAISAECTTKDSSGHCVQVPGQPNQRRGDSTSRNQEKQSDLPSNDEHSAKPIGGSYHNWIDEIHQTHRVNKDSGGVDYYAPLDGNNTCYTEDYRPGKQEYSEYALEDGMAVQTVKRGAGLNCQSSANLMMLKPSLLMTRPSPKVPPLKKCSKRLRTNSLKPISRPLY